MLLVLKVLNKIKKIKNHSKPPNAYLNYFSSDFNKSHFFLIFHRKFSPFIPVTPLGGCNNLSSNILKTVRLNVTFTSTYFKEYSISFIMICSLIDFPLVVL